MWYDAQLLDFVLFAGDTSFAAALAETAKAARIAAQIGADGSMPRELARTRSLHYSYFNLQAFAELATLSGRIGVDLWSYQAPDSGASIRSALDYLMPYVNDQSTWPYEEIDFVNTFQETSQTLRRAGMAYPNGGYDTALASLSANRSPLDQLRLRLGYWPA